MRLAVQRSGAGVVQERDVVGEGAHLGNRLDFDREELLEVGIDARQRDILGFPIIVLSCTGAAVITEAESLSI